MVVRVKVRIERSGKVVETSALANSGYEAETPQLLIPIPLAETLGLWLPTEELALEDVGEGLWRFRWEPRDKLRRSEPPKLWK